MGLAGVLDGLDRRARLCAVPGSAVEWGFTWEDRDVETQRWWPQGIACSGEARSLSPAAYDGPGLLLCAWYAKTPDGTHTHSRVSVVDLTTLRYRHVELVTAAGKPLAVHAGGLAWTGEHLLVAATRRGLGVARLDDVRRVGERLQLPVTSWLRAEQDDEEPLRYSFCSVDAERPGSPRLLVGEYGGRSAPRRTAWFALDPETGLPAGGDGTATATQSGEGPVRMQGMVSVGGVHHVVSSNGRWAPSTLHVGRPGDLSARLGALPVGSEDLTWSPEAGLLWSQSEHPGHRYVFAVRPTRGDARRD